MKLSSALFVLILLGFVSAEDENTAEQEAQEKLDTPDPAQIAGAPRPTANRKQFQRPEFTREGPRFRPNPQFQEGPTRFQSPRQFPDQEPHFRQSELIRRPVFFRERPQFEEPQHGFHMDPAMLHARPQQMRTTEQMRVPTSDMFSDPHSFSLPISQFKPIRVHHSSPNTNTQSQPPQSFKTQKSPLKSASPFPTTFFNMPFSSVAMTPFKVTTALENGANKPESDSKQVQSSNESPKPASENFRFVPQEDVRPFVQSEPQFSSSMLRQRPVASQFEALRSAQDFPSQEFLEPLPPVRRPSFSQFEQPQGSAFEFHPDEMSFGAPISFQVAPDQLDSLRNAQQDDVLPSKSKPKDESKKSVEENFKSTAAFSSGIKFRPFGIAPVHFQHPGSMNSESLRSASLDGQKENAQPGKSPFRPIILRPVKLLSPQGADITKSASSAEDEFKAFMTVSDDDLQPMESSKSANEESLKGRDLPSAESLVEPRKPLGPRPTHQSAQLVRVRPRDGHNPRSGSGSRSVSKPSISSSESEGPRFRSAAPSQRHLMRPISSSFVEYRVQPSYIRSLGPSRANARIYYEPSYFTSFVNRRDLFDRDGDDI